MGERRDAYRFLVGVHEVKYHLKNNWWDNIKTVVEEVGWGGKYLIAVAQDRGRWRAFVGAVMNISVT
jgi:hypothetical protein